MTTGGVTPYTNAARIEMEQIGVGPQEADRRFDIEDLRRKHRLWAEPVVHRRDRVAGGGQGEAHVCRTHALVTTVPAPTMDPDDHRKRTVPRYRQMEIKALRARLRSVLHIDA